MIKYVQIQKQLLEDLRALIIAYNQNHQTPLKLDVAVFYTSLFNSLPSLYRNMEDTHQEVIRLNSQILKKYNRNYAVYMDFLVRNGFIDSVKSYGADINECNSYILNKKYVNDTVTIYQITDTWLLKKFDDNGIETFYKEKMKYCKAIRPHLVSCFNDALSIDTQKANEIINPLRAENYNKYSRAKQLILEFHYQEWRYSIKPDTDFRLHTNLTRLNKVLRPVITYKGQHLGAVDIKSSQPYFFAVILKAVLKKDRQLLKQIGATKLLSNQHIKDMFDLEIDRKEIIDFVQSVIYDDFYTCFVDKLVIHYDENGKIFRKVSNFTKKNKGKFVDNPTRIEYYQSERDVAKTVIMEVFYSSPKSTIPEAKIFRTVYPSVTKIMNFIKTECVEFHRLLSNIEAHCLLDCVAKQYHKKHPEIPLWSIHDSLVTTEPYLAHLEKNMKQLLQQTTTLHVQAEAEPWLIKKSIPSKQNLLITP